MEENKIKDKICMAIAYTLPKRILYWCIIRIWAKLTVEKYPEKHPEEVSCFMALQNL